VPVMWNSLPADYMLCNLESVFRHTWRFLSHLVDSACCVHDNYYAWTSERIYSNVSFG